MISRIDFRGDPSDAMKALEKIEKRTRQVRENSVMNGAMKGSAAGSFAGSLGADAAKTAAMGMVSAVKEVIGLLRKGYTDAIGALEQMDDIRDYAAILGTSSPGVLGVQKTLVEGGASAEDIPKLIGAFGDLARKAKEGDAGALGVYDAAGVSHLAPMIDQMSGIFQLMARGGGWSDAVQSELGLTGKRFEVIGRNLGRDGGVFGDRLRTNIKQFEDNAGYTANPAEYEARMAKAQGDVEMLKLEEAQRPLVNIMSKNNEELTRLVNAYRDQEQFGKAIYDRIQDSVDGLIQGMNLLQKTLQPFADMFLSSSVGKLILPK